MQYKEKVGVLINKTVGKKCPRALCNDAGLKAEKTLESTKRFPFTQKYASGLRNTPKQVNGKIHFYDLLDALIVISLMAAGKFKVRFHWCILGCFQVRYILPVLFVGYRYYY